MRKLTWMMAAMMVLAAGGAIAGEQPLRGKIDSVMLYRGQALVTRVVTLNLPAGGSQVVVDGLPEQILADSLYATTEQGVQVRAVRYRADAVGEAPREEVRALEAEIDGLDVKIRRSQEQQKALAEQIAFLGKLQNFTAPTAQAEMTKGVLDAGTLRELTLFVFEQSNKQTDTAFTKAEEQRTMQKQHELLKAKRAEITKGGPQVRRQAVLFLEKAAAGATQVRLSYLVKNATWSPAYNLRASGDLKNVQVEYNALVQQMSGENWEDVALTLSTASPMTVSDAPALAPLLVGLTQQQAQQQPQTIEQFKDKLSNARSNLRNFEQQRNRSGEAREQNEANWGMNTASNDWQAAELSISGDQARILREMQRGDGSALSVNYKLTGPSNVATRTDQQIVRIADLDLPSTFFYVAMPILGENVYRQAEVANSSDTALLGGHSSVYLNGEFVGSGSVPMVACGQKFVVGFGIDPQLRAWRELISRTEATQGGNREVVFKYRLVLDNYKDVPVTMRAFDRVPYTQNDIRVTLDEPKDKLSEDAEYLRAFRPMGILRWDVQVAAHSAAATARIVEYGYKLEYDRNMGIAPISSGEKAAAARQMFDMQLKK